MNDFFDVLKYILPMLVLGGIFYFWVEKFFTEQQNQLTYRLQEKDRSLFLPQKYQAYERLALFLERIRPVSLVRRVNANGSVDDYVYALSTAIQEEFNHNLSQQIYVEPDTWKVIFSAKNATQSFIVQAAQQLEGSTDAAALQRHLIEHSVDGNMPIDGALLKLQADIQH